MHVRVGNLAVGRRARYQVTRDPQDLRAAEADYRALLGRSDLTAEDRDRTLQNLAVTLLDRARARAGEAGDRAPSAVAALDEAEEVLRDLARRWPPGHADFPTVALTLADCLRIRSELTGDPLPRREGTAILRRLTGGGHHLSATGLVRATVAQARNAAADGDWRTATATYEAALDGLAQAVSAHANRRSRETAVGRFFGIASDAAASALHAGSPERALELLERGRGTLLDEAVARRPHQRPGHRDLLTGLGGRTVVVLNVSRLRCDALAVTPRGLRVLPLPSLSTAQLIRQTARFLWAVRTAGDRSAEQWERDFAERTVVPAVLRWLWHSTMAPVLDGLGLTGHVWWCPTGLLTFLPLHAAGSHLFDRGAGTGGVAESVLDHVVSSYTPAVQALPGPRGGPPGTRRLLAVEPRAAGFDPLPHAGLEIERVRRVVPDGVTLAGPGATRERILAELPRHSWFHFAGHGTQDPLRPAESAALIPYDFLPGQRAVRRADVATLRTDRAEVAFLSACRTATGTMDLADEAAHLAGAFLSAGFRQVIGSQWAVRDRLAAQVAGDFYRLAADPDHSAEALHEAVRTVRAAAGSPCAWAPFVHFGG
ncbi:CHAT domain-containing protein [Streptomyces sp. NPDC001348]